MESNLKIVTYNLRCGWYTGDGINSRIHRSGMIWEIVRSEKPDIISFQEVNKGENLDNLRDILPGYDLYGSGRDGDFGGEGLYTAIRRETTELIGLNIFWLSPKPYEPNAAMYPGQSGCPRICVETLIRHKATGKLIRVYNVHLDFSGALNVRAVQMQQILDRMTENKKYFAAETVLLGDMNDKPHQNAIACANSFEEVPLTDVTKDFEYTYHEYGNEKEYCKIDYIFVSEELAKAHVQSYLWDKNDSGIYLSDHYPVCAIFAI